MVSIDTRLKPYYDNFVDMAPKNCLKTRGIHIGFSSAITAPTAAYCVDMGLLGYYIKVRPDFWEKATELERTHTLWHELAHCELKLGHSKNSNHYMYYAIEYISYEKLQKQTKDDINAFCK